MEVEVIHRPLNLPFDRCTPIVEMPYGLTPSTNAAAVAWPQLEPVPQPLPLKLTSWPAVTVCGDTLSPGPDA